MASCLIDALAAQAETEARVISNFVEEMSALMLAVHEYERRVTEVSSASLYPQPVHN